MKRFSAAHKYHFDKEVETLKLLNAQSNPHIVRLLCTISWRQDHYIVFQNATSDLADFWKSSNHTSSWDAAGKKTFRWVLFQLKGLVSALETIHQLPSTDTAPLRYGRHGDIHADNILVMNSSTTDEFDLDSVVLQIADMGRTTFVASLSAFGRVGETGMYQGPECQLGCPASPLYDIWCLGCVFLEFLTWMVDGPAGIDAFRNARVEPDALLGEVWQDDYFYTITYNNEGCATGATVRSSVAEWMQHLRERVSDQDAFCDVLSLIEADMIQPRAEDRMEAHCLLLKLEGIVARAGLSDH